MEKGYQILESPGNLLNSGNKVFRSTIFKKCMIDSKENQ